MFSEGIRSERQLIATASLNLAHRWYLGYALDEPLPDHSSLTRIRQRLGIDIFQRFFEQVVDLCQEARLIWGREFYVDATKVEANADLDSLMPRFFHEAKNHIADLFANDAPTTTAEAEPKAALDDLPVRVVCLARDSVRDETLISTRPWELLDERRLDPNRPPVGSYRRTGAFRVGLTDPDAAPMSIGSAAALGYHDHYVVDGGKPNTASCAKSAQTQLIRNPR